MKPLAIKAAAPLLTERDELERFLSAARHVGTADLIIHAPAEMHRVSGKPLAVPAHAAQAIIQSMIDRIDADLRELGVDLS